jgi:hypothetical protein
MIGEARRTERPIALPELAERLATYGYYTLLPDPRYIRIEALMELPFNLDVDDLGKAIASGMWRR